MENLYVGKWLDTIDATSIALIYRCKAGCGQLISHDTIHLFEEVVEENLNDLNKDGQDIFMHSRHPMDFCESIYFNSYDEEGKWYSILKPDVDLEKAERQYISFLDLIYLKAILQENALSVLGLQLENHKVVKVKTMQR